MVSLPLTVQQIDFLLIAYGTLQSCPPGCCCLRGEAFDSPDTRPRAAWVTKKPPEGG